MSEPALSSITSIPQMVGIMRRYFQPVVPTVAATAQQNGLSWTSGAGAPRASAPRGSLYSRTDGAVGSTLYVSQGGGTWNAVPSV